MRLLPLVALWLLLGAAPAALAASPASKGTPISPADVQQAPLCQQCSMDRGKFSHSRMIVEYRDGSRVGSCSLHCVAVELANAIDRIPVLLQVADYETKELVDAESAVWVIGGSKRGVMTAQPKWAFAARAAAERFIGENGGFLATFDDAMKAAYLDMYQDTKMIREMRELKRGKPQEVSHKQ